jgi:hypothetical protein
MKKSATARKYEVELPSEEQLVEELTETRRALLLRARAMNSDEREPQKSR